MFPSHNLNWFDDHLVQGAAYVLMTVVWIAGVLLLALLFRWIRRMRRRRRNNRSNGMSE
jgi:Flp pilus assembly protein TadB